MRQYTIKDMHLLAEKHKGKCLSENYINSHTPLQWQCATGHRWTTSPTNVVQGKWCAQCARLARNARYLQQLKDYARKKGANVLPLNSAIAASNCFGNVNMDTLGWLFQNR